jgi:N-dimethylarginine dimethylaminohydrolase
VVAPDGFADPAVAEAIADFYTPAAVRLSPAQKEAFAANCLALAPDEAWFSAAGEKALEPGQRECLRGAGFSLKVVELDEIEKAGGSLRCCVAEVF